MRCYRYGFNGMEKDDEIKGKGNSYDYLNRFFDNRLGRFLSIDKLNKKFSYYTPYQFSGNKPIAAIDLDGLEEYIVNRNWVKTNSGYSLSLRMTYNYPNQGGYRKMREVVEGDPNRTDPDRKADFYINGTYSYSEQTAFDKNSQEYLFEIQDVTVYESRRQADLGRTNGSGTQKCVTLCESIESSLGNADLGLPVRSISNSDYFLFDELYDNYNFDDATITFGTDESDISSDQLPLLDQVASDLLKHPELVVNISGHTSMSGGEEYNQVLSSDRVQSVVDYLSSKLKEFGMSDEQISNKISTDPLGRSEAASKGQANTSDVGGERKVEITYDVNL